MPQSSSSSSNSRLSSPTRMRNLDDTYARSIFCVIDPESFEMAMKKHGGKAMKEKLV